LREAVEQALGSGGSDVGVIRYLLLHGQQRTAMTSAEPLELGWLTR
jgi:hypothetical protein